MSGMIMMVKVRVGIPLQRKLGNQMRFGERGKTEISEELMTKTGRKKGVLTSAQNEMICVAPVVPFLAVTVFCRQSVDSLWMNEIETGEVYFSIMAQTFAIESC